jgi:hypothetical protein
MEPTASMLQPRAIASDLHFIDYLLFSNFIIWLCGESVTIFFKPLHNRPATTTVSATVHFQGDARTS